MYIFSIILLVIILIVCLSFKHQFERFHECSLNICAGPQGPQGLEGKQGETGPQGDPCYNGREFKMASNAQICIGDQCLDKDKVTRLLVLLK